MWPLSRRWPRAPLNFFDVRDKIYTLISERDDSSTEKEQAQTDLASTKRELAKTKADLKQTQQQLADTQAERAKAGHRHDPAKARR